MKYAPGRIDSTTLSDQPRALCASMLMYVNQYRRFAANSEPSLYQPKIPGKSGLRLGSTQRTGNPNSHGERG